MTFVLTVLTLFLTFTISCKSVPKNRNTALVPETMQCPVDTDPTCIGGSTAALEVPVGPSPDLPSDAPKSKAGGKVSGRCELYVTAENKLLPCEGLKLLVRSTKNGETRAARFNGYGFEIEGLKDGVDYRVEALADKYDVTTDTRTLRPGQNRKIRVIAKPRL